jgi:hypothetical protein
MHWMQRTLTVLFRRDPQCDRQNGNVSFEGYQILWPDGKPVATAMDAFCKHGQRLLGLGKYLSGSEEKAVNLVFLPLAGRDENITRIPGHRVRRFYIERKGHTGRVHFLDGTPTVSIFNNLSDDPRILKWIGMNDLRDGEVLWFDLAAMEADTPVAPRLRMQTA